MVKITSSRTITRWLTGTFDFDAYCSPPIISYTTGLEIKLIYLGIREKNVDCLCNGSIISIFETTFTISSPVSNEII